MPQMEISLHDNIRTYERISCGSLCLARVRAKMARSSLKSRRLKRWMVNLFKLILEYLVLNSGYSMALFLESYMMV